MIIGARFSRWAVCLMCSLPAMLAPLVGGTYGARAADVNVGPSRALKTLQAGIAAASPNDRVVLDAGVYLDDVSNIDKPLTIEGAGSGAILRVTKPIPNHKGILVVNADLTVRKVTFEGAFVTDADGKNGAGIRHQVGKLIVEACVFLNNQNGILANSNKDATISIRHSGFSGNGAGDGYTHGIYVNAIARLDISDSSFAGTKVGHNIKSRAYQTTITDTTLDDGVSGTPSYAVDLPNGGKAVLKGLRITQGPRTSNTAMIAFGAEPPLHDGSSLTVTVPLRSRERAFARTMADILLSNMPDEWCSFSKNSAYIRFSFSDCPAEKMRVRANSSWTLCQCAGREPMQFMAP